MELKSDEEKAASFMRMNTEINKLTLDKADRQVKVRELGAYEDEGEDDKGLTMEELEVALNQTVGKKRGGFDEIEPAMIRNLPREGKIELLAMFN